MRLNPMRRFALAAALLLAACGENGSPTGPITGAGGRVTFTPDPLATVRGVTIRAETPEVPNDNRWIVGSAFHFDPGQATHQDTVPGMQQIGVLTVSYAGLPLPEGTVEGNLRLAVRTRDYWMIISDSYPNPTDKVVRAPVNLDFGPGLFAVFTPRGMVVYIDEISGNTVAGDSLRVAVRHETDVPLSSITASVLDRSRTLAPEPAYSSYWYVGWIPLQGLAPGTYVARATATRIDGLALTDTMVFTKR